MRGCARCWRSPIKYWNSVLSVPSGIFAALSTHGSPERLLPWSGSFVRMWLMRNAMTSAAAVTAQPGKRFLQGLRTRCGGTFTAGPAGGLAVSAGAERLGPSQSRASGPNCPGCPRSR